MNMWPFGREKSPAKTPEKKKVTVRSFSAAEINRLTSSWGRSNTTIDQDLRNQLKVLRGRSRDLAANNEFAKRFFQQIKTNVVGPNGMTLQNRARDPNGKLDKMANTAIERRWASWGKLGQCDVTGTFSLPDFERLGIETVAKDGEVLIKVIPGFDNDQGFALQIIEADFLDSDLNETLDNGNRIRLGVELDAWGRRVAYYLMREHPGSIQGQTRRDHIRVPADEIIHLFIPIRPHQSRGVPWMHAAMIGLNDLGGYREAAIIASRVGASKMGFFTTPTGTEYDGTDVAADGSVITDAEPGTFEQLAEGTDFKQWDPAYPHDQFESFNKAALRGIAGGLGVAYHTFANDLEGVNFSSARAGVLEERDYWMLLQNWFSQALHDQVFPKWLSYQLNFGGLMLPANKFDKFNAATWQGRRWQWVDPLKDVQANKLAVDERIRSRSDIIREQGRDPDDVWDEIAAENEKLAELGIGMMPKEEPDNEPPPQDDEGEEEQDEDERFQQLEARLDRLRQIIETRDGADRITGKLDEILNKPESRGDTIVNVPEQPAPVVNVQNDINVPRQEPPVVNVENQIDVPTQPVPDVRVEVTNDVKTPEVKVENNIDIPEGERRVRFERDRDGKIVSADITDG